MKILFIAYSLDGGGAEKALVNLLNMLVDKDYDITLQLFENRGINFEYLPSNVKVLPDLKSKSWLMSNSKTFLKNAIKKINISILFKRLYSAIKPIFKKHNNSRYKKMCFWEVVLPICTI